MDAPFSILIINVRERSGGFWLIASTALRMMLRNTCLSCSASACKAVFSWKYSNSTSTCCFFSVLWTSSNVWLINCSRLTSDEFKADGRAKESRPCTILLIRSTSEMSSVAISDFTGSAEKSLLKYWIVLRMAVSGLRISWAAPAASSPKAGRSGTSS